MNIINTCIHVQFDIYFGIQAKFFIAKYQSSKHSVDVTDSNMKNL